MQLDQAHIGTREEIQADRCGDRTSDRQHSNEHQQHEAPMPQCTFQHPAVSAAKPLKRAIELAEEALWSGVMIVMPM